MVTNTLRTETRSVPAKESSSTGNNLLESLLKHERQRSYAGTLAEKAKAIYHFLKERGMQAFRRDSEISLSPADPTDKDTEEYLRGIQLQQRLFEIIEDSDVLEPDKILQELGGENLSPDEVKYFTAILDELHKRQYRSFAYVSRLRRAAHDKISAGENAEFLDEEMTESFTSKVDDETARTIFIAATGVYPEGKPKLVRTKFAVGIRVDNRNDLSALATYNAKHVGGFFRDNTETKLTAATVSEWIPPVLLFKEFPLLVIGDNGPIRTQEHEEEHSVNKAVREALRGLGMSKEVWSGEHQGPEGRTKTQATDAVTRLIKSKNIEVGKASVELKKALVPVLLDVLTRSKDEVIADFAATGTFDHLNNLRLRNFSDNEHESYNYFIAVGFTRENFKKPPLPEVYDSFVREYNTLLADSTRDIHRALKGWKKFDIPNKHREMLEFMRRTPLHLWKERFALIYGSEQVELQALHAKGEQAEEAVEKLIDKVRNVSVPRREYVEDDKALNFPELKSKLEPRLTQLDQRIQQGLANINIDAFIERFAESVDTYSRRNSLDLKKMQQLDIHAFISEVNDNLKDLEALELELDNYEKFRNQAIKETVEHHPLLEFVQTARTAIREMRDTIDPEMRTELQRSYRAFDYINPAKQTQKANEYDRIMMEAALDYSTSGRGKQSNAYQTFARDYPQHAQFLDTLSPLFHEQRKMIDDFADERHVFEDAFSDVYSKIQDEIKAKASHLADRNSTIISLLDPSMFKLDYLTVLKNVEGQLTPGEQQAIAEAGQRIQMANEKKAEMTRMTELIIQRAQEFQAA